MTGRLPTPPSICSFPDCDRESIAHGLCFSHYRQQLRHKDLTPLRRMRGLKTLPLTIRVDDTTKAALEARVEAGQAKSLYEATRQAIEAGVVSWGVVYPPFEPHKRKKTNGEALPEAEPAIKVEEAVVHDALVKMKDGREFRGPIWAWKPAEGWFSIPSDSTAPEKILLSEVESAVAPGTRTHPGVVEDVDLIHKATTDGWTP